MADDGAVLTVRDVNKFHGTLQTLKDVSLTVKPGEKRALIGPNGAGKTSLFNIIGGQWPASSGSIVFDGRKIDHMSPHRRAALGISRTFQITNVFQELTVEENIQIAVQGRRRGKFDLVTPRGRRRDLREQAAAVLERAHMLPRRGERVKNLSYGQQRILEVLVAMAAGAELLLLDEPTAGLSPLETGRMISRLQELGENRTMILIEHDMDVCFQLVDTISVLHHGTVLADGTKEEVRENPAVQEIYLGAM